MTAYDVRSLIAVLIGLFVWCALYARVLALPAIHGWYAKNNKTWVVVVVGWIWILIALGVLVVLDVFDGRDLGIVILCCAAAGAPIIIWQYLQDSRHRAIYDATQRRKRGTDHDTDDPRRAGRQ